MVLSLLEHVLSTETKRRVNMKSIKGRKTLLDILSGCGASNLMEHSYNRRRQCYDIMKFLFSDNKNL